MTSTRAINAAAGVIHAAMQQGKSLPQTIAYALDSAGLLNSPETAAELVELRKLPARVAELEAQLAEYLPVDEQRIPFVLTSVAELAVEPEALHASSGAVVETTAVDGSKPLAHIPDYGHGTEVNGCRHCGVTEREHMQRWSRRDGERGPGWHMWTQPTQEQIKERMLRRRSVNELRALLAGQREDPHDSPLHHPYAKGRDLPEVQP